MLLDGRTFEWSGHPIALAGERAATVLIFCDVSEQDRAQIDTERLVAIVDSSDEAVIGKDLEGVITSWNQAAERIFGYRAEEIVGTSILRLIPPDRHAEEFGILERIRRGEKVDHFETMRLRKDGRQIAISVTSSPIKDSSGRVIGASKLARDITEQKEAEAALRTSDLEFKAMMNALPQLAWIARADGHIFWYNERWFDYTGRTAAEMDGWGWQEVHDPEILPLVLERWQGAIASGETFDMEFPLRRADGRFRWFLTRGVPVRNEAGEVIRWIGTNTDISEKRETEEEIHHLNETLELRVRERTAQLEAANNELEAFSYSVSHDLRAPLRAVDGFSQAVLEDYGPELPEEGQRYLQTIRSSAQRMGALIDDLLAFSRLSRTPLARQPVEMTRHVQETLQELESETKGRALELKIGELPNCEGDPTLLRQVWMNLLSNALKYSARRDPAIVEVGATEHDGQVTYFVRDNGTGFDMSYASKLFGVFQRLHREEEFSGTGVGLAIVQRIVHRHGGTIWAEAEPDRGATFSFTLTPKENS